MSTDPRKAIAESRMTAMQITVVGITILLNALDGFDVLSISFASPGIAAEWGINRAALGIVLSMELAGMAVGSVLIGRLADVIGRRNTLLGCCSVMFVGMLMASTATGIVSLSIWRVLTGLGIGGMLAAINAVAAEFSSAKRKHLCVSLMAIGYPVGAVVGGSIAAQLLETYDWRSVFYLGAALTAMCIPLIWFLVPESVHWLADKRPANALERINRTLKKIGHATVTAVPPATEEEKRASASGIFSPAFLTTTLIVTTAYFLHITTFYFVIKWIPKIVVDMGFVASSAAGVLVWANVGGALGGATLGFLTLKFNVKRITVFTLAVSTIMVIVFGRSPADLDKLAFYAAAAGFFTNASIVGLYAIFAHAYPTHIRASGTGFAVGVGRGGAVIGPIVAGFLFESGLTLPQVAIWMAAGSCVAAAALAFLKLHDDDRGERAPARNTKLEPAPESG